MSQRDGSSGHFMNHNLTMEEELCAEEPLGPSTVAHGDCKQQHTTVGKNNNNNTANAVERQTANQMRHTVLGGLVLTGSYERRTLESSSCCSGTADNARESGSGLTGPEHGFHTPNTSDVLHHTRKSCRSAAQTHVFPGPCTQPPPPG